MCWNEEVSWATFILGTLANVFLVNKIKNKNIFAIALIWQWVLLMQLFEALIWRSKKCGTLNKIGTTGAFIANVTQPLIVFLAILMLTKQGKSFKLFGGLCIILYLLYIISKYQTMKTLECIEPKKECNHLNYVWWKHISPTPYILTLCLLLVLAKPSKTYIPQLVYVLATLIIASNTNMSCGVGSAWCWLAAFAPIFTYVYHKKYLK